MWSAETKSPLFAHHLKHTSPCVITPWFPQKEQRNMSKLMGRLMKQRKSERKRHETAMSFFFQQEALNAQPELQFKSLEENPLMCSNGLVKVQT